MIMLYAECLKSLADTIYQRQQNTNIEGYINMYNALNIKCGFIMVPISAEIDSMVHSTLHTLKLKRPAVPSRPPTIAEPTPTRDRFRLPW